MLQEDSNGGDASFEIIEKKNEEGSNAADKTESLSSVSSYSIPSPSQAGGNLLSNIPPPSNLPDFTILRSSGVTPPAPLPINLGVSGAAEFKPVTSTLAQFPQPQFSAAIPPSKGLQHGASRQQSIDTATPSSSAGFMGWVKDAVSTGGLLSKVAEKAKNSVDSLITTLDPQMSEFIYSGGDLEFVIASQEQDEIVPIRDAIFSVFGKAWVNGASIKIENKHQANGFDEGLQRAENKVIATLALKKAPVIAIENILLQQNEQWFDLSVILLKDPEKEITLHTYTQTNPIPLDVFLDKAEKEMPGYAKECESIDKILAAYLQVSKNNWQQTICGVSRKDSLYLAAKTLVSLYKTRLLIQ